MIHKDAYLANSSLLKAHPSLLYRHMTIMRTLSSWVSGVMIYCHLVSGFGLMETTIWCRHLDLYSVKCEYYLKLVASLSFLSALIQEHVLSVRPSVQFRAITRGWSLSKKTDWRPLSYKKVNYVIHYNSNVSAFRSSFFFFLNKKVLCMIEIRRVFLQTFGAQLQYDLRHVAWVGLSFWSKDLLVLPHF